VTHRDITTLLDYHYWARDRILAAAEALTPEQYLRELGSSFKSVRDTLAHTYAAEWAWHQRWHGTSPTSAPDFTQWPDAASLRAVWLEIEQRVRSYIDGVGEAGLARIVEFKTLAGDPGALPLWQLVQHVVNHGSYHRGQVTTMIRQLGGVPPKSMDLVAYYRTLGVKR